MKRDYKFTSRNFDKDRYEHFITLVDEQAKLERLTPWEDIRPGEVYHIPNLLTYKRCDYIVHEKKVNFINGIMKEEGSNDWKNYSLFKDETRTKFLVRRISTLK
jgi:hypothetical protein